MGFKDKPKVVKFDCWSFSRWSAWKQCPLAAKYQHIDKLPTPKHPAMQRGADLADIEEKYLKKEIDELPEDLKMAKPRLDRLREIPDLIVESKWGLTQDWKPVGYFDWNKCKLRSKIDVGYIDDNNVLQFTDNKTGKFREFQVDAYMLQLDLYTAAAIAYYPDLKGIQAKLHFTDLDDYSFPQKPKVVTPKQALKKQAEWDIRFEPMINERRWPAKPGPYCKWCPFGKSKGGPCKFG